MEAFSLWMNYVNMAQPLNASGKQLNEFIHSMCQRCIQQYKKQFAWLRLAGNGCAAQWLFHVWLAEIDWNSIQSICCRHRALRDILFLYRPRGMPLAALNSWINWMSSIAFIHSIMNCFINCMKFDDWFNWCNQFHQINKLNASGSGSAPRMNCFLCLPQTFNWRHE